MPEQVAEAADRHAVVAAPPAALAKGGGRRHGIGDLIVGNDRDNGGGHDSGAAYVVSGRAGGFTSPAAMPPIPLQGGDGGDFIYGLGGDNRAFGGNGNRQHLGRPRQRQYLRRSRDDILAGDRRAELLTGGAAGDHFVHRFTSDSRGDAEDTIPDFTHGKDKIDLSALGPLDFIGSDPFSAADQVRAIVSSGHTRLQVNIAGTSGRDGNLALARRDRDRERPTALTWSSSRGHHRRATGRMAGRKRPRSLPMCYLGSCRGEQLASQLH